MIRHWLLSCLTGFALVSGRAAAQVADPHEAQPERPSVATHAGTVAPGWLEVEGGVERDGSGEERVWQSIIATKIGLARNLQFTLQVPLASPPSSPLGLADISLGVKWRFLSEHRVLGDMAVLPSLKFSTGSRPADRGTGTTDGGLLLISSHAIGDVSVDANVGIIERSGDGAVAPRTATMWAVAGSGPAWRGLGWGAEVSGYPRTSGSAGSDSSVALLGGPTLRVRPSLVLDAGIFVPVSGPLPRVVFAGAVYNVGRLFGPAPPPAGAPP